MNGTEVFAAISGLISITASIAALVIAWRKAPAEVRHIESSTGSTDADTAGKYQTIADRAAERALLLDKRIQDLEKRSGEQAEEIQRLKSENARLAHWAQRLVHQVKAMGGEPIPMPEDGEKGYLEVRREAAK